MSDLYVQIIWKSNPSKVTTTRVSSEGLAKYQANLGTAWDDIETFTVSVNPIPAPDALDEIALHNIDIIRDRKSDAVSLNLFNRDDKKVAVINTTAVNLQAFALRVLQQTTYSFLDILDK